MQRLSAALLMSLLLLALSGSSVAQPSSLPAVRVGVLLPSERGGEIDSYLAVRAAERSLLPGLRGMQIEPVYAEGGTTRADTSAGLRQLIAEGVHAVICCQTGESALAAQEFAGQLPILSLAAPPALDAQDSELLLMQPDELSTGRALALAASAVGQAAALLTVADHGEDARTAGARAGSIEAGIPLVEAVAYEPGASALTPEALLAAASGANVILLWTDPEDTLRALRALDARGYEESVVLPFASVPQTRGGPRLTGLNDVMVLAPPIALANELPPAHPNRRALDRFMEALRDSYRGYPATLDGAVAFDALGVITDAAQYALAYGVPPSSTASFRLALRDSLNSSARYEGAAGTYGNRAGRGFTALPEGLVPSIVQGGRLVPLE